MQINEWGMYSWFKEDGVDMIHPQDVHEFTQESNRLKVYMCSGRENEYNIIQYGEKKYRVEGEFFKTVPEPKYKIGETVYLPNGSAATICDIMWHFNRKEEFYFVLLNNKRKKTRYFADELRTQA